MIHDNGEIFQNYNFALSRILAVLHNVCLVYLNNLL